MADDVSRGISVQSLTGRWQYGPDFLRLPEREWPKDASSPDTAEVEKEKIKIHVVNGPSKLQQPIDCKRFSSWRKLVRVTAYVLRFVWNLRTQTYNRVEGRVSKPINDGPLSTEELQNGEKYWIQECQTDLKDRLNKGEFNKLSPFRDPEGVYRVGGRVDRALFSYETKHPSLLPREHWVSRLIVRPVHRCGHTGIAATVAKIRSKYWIIGAHDLAKSVKFRCVFCREMGAKTEFQVMADLPPSRVAPLTPPFYFTSCDYFGPYSVRIGRNKTTKHYGVIFTCLNTRAVHLDLAVDCSTMEFIQVLRRFFALEEYPP